MRLLADNDVVGAVEAIRRVLAPAEWAPYARDMDLQFVRLRDVGLPMDAPDHDVWLACQETGVLLVTGNRSGGTGSLEEAISHGGASDLPVVTIANPRRALMDRPYAERCAFRLLAYVESLEALRGAGRIYIP